MTTALIVAAGRASRLGFDKLMAPLAGEPVILRSIRAFEACQEINAIIVVSTMDRTETIRTLAAAAGIEKLLAVAPGGPERYQSVWNGLQALPADCKLVAVHDGARPLITPDQISRCVARAAETGAAACARRVTETLKIAANDGLVTGSVDRDGLWIMETPQVFARSLLEEAYRIVIAGGSPVTDEVSALQMAGCPVWLVENLAPNPKITLPGDLETAARQLA